VRRRATISKARTVDSARCDRVPHSESRINSARERDCVDMARLARGDDQALESLMRRHAKPLLQQLECIVGNHSDAKELANQAFLRVFRHRLDFDFESPFTAWLYVIGSRLAISLLRWRARQPEFAPLPKDAAACSGAGTDAFVDPGPTPREQAERDEWTGALELALASLPEHFRVPLLLVSLDGCSHAEVASRLGCTVKAVETRVYHGRIRLRLEVGKILNPSRGILPQASYR